MVTVCCRRRILDEDNREVKILQELLLEDGELHGSGRQKQFRWKNIGEYFTLFCMFNI